MQSTLEVWKMKANDVGELKRSVASEKNRANLLQAELRTPRNKKLDKVLENSNKQDRDSKMSHMKALTSLQVSEVKDSNKLEFKAQSQQMQRRNEKERFAGLHINDLHNVSNIMQQYTSSMGMQSPWQQQSMMPQMMQQEPPNYMMQKQQSMMPPIMPQGQPNYMMPQPNQQGPPPNYMMPQPNNYWCFPNGMMQQENELNGNGATFSPMQQQASDFPVQSM